MGVEGTAEESAIIRAVEQAGYGAAVKGAKTSQPQENALEDRETPKLKRRLMASVSFLALLMYLSMGHMMWGWPLPRWFDGNPWSWSAGSPSSWSRRAQLSRPFPPGQSRPRSSCR